MQEAPTRVWPWMGSCWSPSLDPLRKLAQLLSSFWPFFITDSHPGHSCSMHNLKAGLLSSLCQPPCWHFSTFLLTVLKQSGSPVGINILNLTDTQTGAPRLTPKTKQVGRTVWPHRLLSHPYAWISRNHQESSTRNVDNWGKESETNLINDLKMRECFP